MRILVPLLVAGGLILAAPQPAAAYLQHSCDTDAGEYPKVVYYTVWVPNRITNAETADVVLTDNSNVGGNPVVVAITQAGGQLYTHTMFVSDPGDDYVYGPHTMSYASTHTRFTHFTGLTPAMRVDTVGLLDETVRLVGDDIARFAPGNVRGDSADTLLEGWRPNCLNEAIQSWAAQAYNFPFFEAGVEGVLSAAAPDWVAADAEDYCIEQRARPVSLSRTSALLVRAAPGYEAATQQALTDFLAPPASSKFYSIYSYTDLDEAFDGTGIEAQHGGGASCSGGVGRSLEDAGAGLTQRHYSAQARSVLVSTLVDSLYDLALDNLALNDPALADFVGTTIARQVTNCFVFGGDCESIGTGYLNPGPGWTYAPDDVLPLSQAASSGTPGHQQTDWGIAQTATFGGGYDVTTDGTLFCCFENQNGESCYEPSNEATPWLGAGFVGGPNVETPTPARPVKEVLARLQTRTERATSASVDSVARVIMAQRGGEFVESSDEYCYRTADGAVCTVLPATEEEPESFLEYLRRRHGSTTELSSTR